MQRVRSFALPSFLTLLLALSLAACSDDDGGSGNDAGLPDAAPTDARVNPDAVVQLDAAIDGSVDPDGGTVDPPIRSCDTVFSYRPSGVVGSVQLAGEWGWATPEAMTPDGTGAYTITKTLPTGLYAYKFVVDGNWILDPVNFYRKYDGGVENSGMRVPDCRDPLLEVVSFESYLDEVTVRVRMLRGSSGAALDPATVRAVLVKDFQEEVQSLPIVNHAFDGTLSALEAGKQTLRFEAADVDGRVAQPLRLPFWVESTPFDYRDSAIYMVMLDRFRDEDPTNNPAPTADAEPTADWYGGDLAGVAAAIDEGYFDGLGIRTLWFSPFVRNPDHSEISGDGAHRVTGYHGYWPTRAREVDPRFGTEADLEYVVTAAHAHGIRILMDFVLNHVHEEHEYYQAHPEWFRTGCVCGTPGCDWTTNRLDCQFMTYLPDVNWQVPEASEALIADALWWLERFDLDGMRVDAVKHVEDAAIFNLSIRVHEAFEQGGVEHFLLGETAMGWGGPDVNNSLNDYNTISRYIGESGLNGQFDFVLYHAVSYNTFADSTYGLIHADYWLQQSLIHYPAGSIMTPYLGSHDTSRFVTLADPGSAGLEGNQWSNLPSAPGDTEAYDRLRVGLAWLLNLPGAPLLYYGDEYGEFGAADPDNRHRFRLPAERSANESALYDFVAALGTARRVSTALRRGEYQSLLAEEQFLAFARYTATDLAVVCLNTSTTDATRTVTLPGTLPIPVVGFEDALVAGSEYTVVGNAVTVTVPARSAVVLVPFGS